jgi:hypothetical protein
MFASTLIAGCASTALNYNTLDLASTTNDLLSRQVLYNLSNFIDSDLAYPAQVVINSGTASTSDTISANYSTPLTSAITTTAQTVRTVAASPSTATTSLATGVRAGESAGASGTDVRTQNWAYAPITNAFQARRLMALYRYAVNGDDELLRKTYPKIFQSVTHTRNVCLLDDKGNPVTISATKGADKPPPGQAAIDVSFSRCVTSWGSGNQLTATTGSDSSTTMRPDPYYLQGPGCVLCISSAYKRKLVVNPRLSGHWLHWRASTGASGTRPDTYNEGDISLGRFGHYELFVDPHQSEKFPEFVAFILAASTQSDTGGGSSAGGGGASQGGAKQAVQPFICQADPSGNFICQ